MKRLICCITLVAAMCGYALYVLFYTKTVADDISGMIDGIVQSFENEDHAKAARLAAEAEGRWRSLCDDTIFIEENDLNMEISMSLSKVREFADNKNDEIFVECGLAKNLLRSFVYRQEPLAVNIF